MAPIKPTATPPSSAVQALAQGKKAVRQESAAETQKRVDAFSQQYDKLKSPQGILLANILTDLSNQNELLPPADVLAGYLKNAALAHKIPAGKISDADLAIIKNLFNGAIVGNTFSQRDLGIALGTLKNVETQKSPEEQLYDQKVAQFVQDNERHATDSKAYQQNLETFKKENAAYLEKLVAYKQNPTKVVAAPFIGGIQAKVSSGGLGNNDSISMVGSVPLDKEGYLRLQVALDQDLEGGGKTRGDIGVRWGQKPNTSPLGGSFYADGRLGINKIPVVKETERQTITADRKLVSTTTGGGTEITTTTTTNGDGSQTVSQTSTDTPGTTTTKLVTSSPTTASTTSQEVDYKTGFMGEVGHDWGARQFSNKEGFGLNVHANGSYIPGSDPGAGVGARVSYQDNVKIFVPLQVRATLGVDQRLNGSDGNRTTASGALSLSAGGGSPASITHVSDADVEAFREASRQAILKANQAAQ
jgi:hypothetical protein